MEVLSALDGSDDRFACTVRELSTGSHVRDVRETVLALRCFPAFTMA